MQIQIHVTGREARIIRVSLLSLALLFLPLSVCGAMLTYTGAILAPATTLKEFAMGTPVVSADINSNFSILANAINTLDANLKTLTGNFNTFVINTNNSITTLNGNVTTLNSNLSIVATEVVPANGVVFFPYASCPTYWTEQTALRGRYIVGLPGGLASGRPWPIRKTGTWRGTTTHPLGDWQPAQTGHMRILQ